MQQEGTYSGTLRRGVLSKAKSGSPQFALVFDITQFYNGTDWTGVSAMERTLYLSMSGKAKEFTKKKLASLGFDVSGPPKIEKDGDEQVLVLPEGIGDEQVSLQCKHEDYQGEMKERWELASWGGGNTGEAASDEDVLKLAAIW